MFLLFHGSNVNPEKGRYLKCSNLSFIYSTHYYILTDSFNVKIALPRKNPNQLLEFLCAHQSQIGTFQFLIIDELKVILFGLKRVLKVTQCKVRENIYPKRIGVVPTK